jgi:hypothetical protein
VGTAQLRALAGDLPARSVDRSPRPLPSAGTGTAVVPAAEKLAGPAAEVTRQLGIDLRPSLARTPRPGPPAPSALLDRHAVTGAHSLHDPPGRRGAPRSHTVPDEADVRRSARLEQPDHDTDGGRGRRHTSTDRTAPHPHGEPHVSGDRGVGRVEAAAAVESGAERSPGSQLPHDDRGTPEGRTHGVRRDATGGLDRRQAARDLADGLWPEARPDDAEIEAAMQRVLTDAARRYGIEV